MVDTVTVDNEEEFVREIVGNDDLETTDAGAKELWRIWSFRHDNGATDDVLVAIPGWYAQDELGKRHPFLFAQVEHDDPDKGAVLFDDARVIDVNIVENELWDDVTISKTLDVVDLTEKSEYVDERGLIWIPRTLMTVYERS